MSDHAVRGAAPANAASTAAPAGAATPPVTHARTRSRTAWVGWLYFGGAMMVLLGTFNLIEGLVALFNDEYYVATPQGLLVFDITGWGWIHLTIGVVAIVVGVGVFTGAMWARICGVIVCAVNAITQLAFLSAYPLWAVVVITLDILVIWALIVHGDEARDSS
jgi:hypothetical protein